MQFYISTKIAQAHYKSNSNKGPGYLVRNKEKGFDWVAKADFENISKAKLGDKTMVDALYPALMAGMEKEGDIREKMDAAAQAAKDGAAKTKEYVAKFGRAKNVGAVSLGHEDPGAVSMSVLFAAMAQALH